MGDTRQFVITRVQKTGQKGQNTSFDANKTFSGKQPMTAASKAFTALCKKKKIRGQCSLNITMKEVETTPSGSPSMRSGKVQLDMYNKEYKYRFKRKKDPVIAFHNGVPVTYLFTTKGKSLKTNNSRRIKF